uniref:Uncharacterized protein n=1 Tax=Wuchereria bancrofti TaxID=6293 RepID=A0AAF5Q1P8_WUCBA
MNEYGGTYRSTIDRFNTIGIMSIADEYIKDCEFVILMKNANSCEFMMSYERL